MYCDFAIDFLMNWFSCDDSCDISYRPYGSIVESISIKDAATMIENDIEEMKVILSAYGPVNEKHACDIVTGIWEKKLVKFK